MTSSKSSCDDVLSDSWVDVGFNSPAGTGTPASVIQQLNVDDYLRLLREAQRESNQSSARVSLAGSRRDSPRSSPKSPPNSPVQGNSLNLEWQSYYLNYDNKEHDPEFFNGWSSRPDQMPPKNWAFRHPKSELVNIRCSKFGNSSLFSRKGLCTLLITNLISLLIGTGIGMWISKHGFSTIAIKVR